MTITTQQFNKLVTKKDLARMEERMDKKFAAKKDLEKLEQKMDNKFDAAFDMFASKEDLKELRQDIIEEVGGKIDRVFTAVDSIAGTHQEIGAERAANIGAHDRIEADIAKTNKRVTVVEKKLEAVHVSAR